MSRLVMVSSRAYTPGQTTDAATAGLSARAPALESARPPAAFACGSAESAEGMAWLGQVLGSSVQAREQWSELLRLAATSAETPVRAQTLNLVGQFASVSGDAVNAQAFFQEALIAGRAVQNAAGVARSLTGLAGLAVGRGAFDLAGTLQEEALQLQRRLGQTGGAACSLAMLGWLFLEQRGPQYAETLHEESLTMRVAQRDQLGVAHSLVHLGWLAHLTGRPETARRHLSEALTTVRHCADRWKVVALLALLGRPASWQAPIRHAATLLIGAESHLAMGDSQDELYEDSAAILAEGRHRLAPRALAVVWSGDHRVEADMLVDQVLQAGQVHGARHRHAGDGSGEAMPLTARELEVAVLIGRGRTNRRIAEELVIAERTAETHARNIRERLGLSTRAQIAAWVAARGLLDGERCTR